ncbi:autotransporter domain-containing protein [Lentilitoribacter sp. Alg239-R112]|uniref:beta strand repeat-containing protein n=1 Tax=Lentilitoribacter sp. Alg239-R112 TaxID=2305987 RepID=UPI0013A70925|nr:autotransporter domain-containing protein [Lentilitoribacter sp. Alg239-R112]
MNCSKNPSFSILKLKKALLASVPFYVLAATGVLTSSAMADDFVVSTAVTTTNNGNTIDGADTLTITPSGSIATTADDAVDAVGSNNVIVNNGSLGGFVYGVHATAGSGGSLTNNNSITGGDNGVVVNMIDFSILNNNGASITGDNNGLRIAGNSTSVVVRNYGQIEGLANDGIAVDTDAIDTIIYNYANASITGDDRGVYLSGDGGSRLENFGTITGNTLEGVVIDSGDAVVRNNGLIESMNSHAIEITTGSNISIENYSSITGDDNGISVNDGTSNVTVSNYNGAEILSSTANGITHGGSDSLLNNFGTINGFDYGVATSTAAANFEFNNHGSLTAVNIGFFVNSEDTTLANHGSINGTAGRGVSSSSTASDFVVNNYGTIQGTTNGVFVEGARAIIHNYGNIESGGVGINLLTGAINSSVLNDGEINTVGVGILSDAMNTRITNSGIISSDGRAIELEFNADNAIVINNGTLVAEDTGVYVDTDLATITNNGRILSNGFGINIEDFAPGNATILNHGEIITGYDGEDNILSAHVGIWADGVSGSNTTNSGKIINMSKSTNPAIIYAILIDNNTNILNLLAPSYLGGHISYGSATTVNITTGPSHSVIWTLDETSAPVVSGPVAGFYNAVTDQFATYDPTVLAVAFDQLGESAGLISDLAALKADQTAPWIAGFGGFSSFDGNAATLDRNTFAGGFAFGNQFELGNGFVFNAMAGYLRNSSSASSRWSESFDNSSNGFFVHANSAFNAGMLDVNVGLSTGYNSHSDRRFVNDNLATNDLGQHLGEAWSTSKYSSFWISPEIRISRQLGQVNGWDLTPSLQTQYAHQSISGFTEAGSNGDAVVGTRSLGIVTTKAELSASKMMGFGQFTGRVGIQSRNAVSGQSADVTLIGINQSVSSGFEDRVSGYLGAEGQFALGNSGSFNVGSKVSFGSGRSSFSANAKFKVTF